MFSFTSIFFVQNNSLSHGFFLGDFVHIAWFYFSCGIRNFKLEMFLLSNILHIFFSWLICHIIWKFHQLKQGNNSKSKVKFSLFTPSKFVILWDFARVNLVPLRQCTIQIFFNTCPFSLLHILKMFSLKLFCIKIHSLCDTSHHAILFFLLEKGKPSESLNIFFFSHESSPHYDMSHAYFYHAAHPLSCQFFFCEKWPLSHQKYSNVMYHNTKFNLH